MFGFKRSTRPAAAAAHTAPAIAPTELAYAAAWGLTWTDWSAATEDARRDMRNRVVYGPYFSAAPRA